MSTQIRVPLKENVNINDVDTLAWREEWNIQASIPRTRDNPYEVIFTAEDGTSIHYIEDFLLGVNYLLLEGEDPAPTAERILGKLPTYSIDEIQRLVERCRTRDEQIRAIYLAAAATTPRFDASLYRLFEITLASNNPEVRSAAILGMGYAAWPAFKALLQPIEATDPDARVREDARAMLESLERVWRDD
jgi:hypothetical protein